MTKRCLILALAALAACSEGPTDPVSTEAPAPSAEYANGPAAERTYRITIYNLTDGQPLTPPIMATHRRGLRIFRPGARASEGIMQLAENGNGDPLLTSLVGDSHVSAVAAATAPVMAGGSLSMEVTGSHNARRLSWASMLICTNDGFTGLRGARLPHAVGQKKIYTVGGYDAGTEVNTEDFSDIVPPCPVLTGVSTSETGTGMSDPELAENGKIRHHRGIHGRDDLIPSLHGWRGPVAKVMVERIS